MLSSLWQLLIDNRQAIIDSGVYVTAISAAVWLIQTNITTQRKYEETIRDKRLETYRKALQPFIAFLATASGSPAEQKRSQQEAGKTFKSKEYRALAFELTFIGSDRTVRAFNSLWQFFYALDKNPELDTKTGLLRLGDLLVNIRRDLGNRSTSLESMEMLAWMISDIDDFQPPRFWWIPGMRFWKRIWGKQNN